MPQSLSGMALQSATAFSVVRKILVAVPSISVSQFLHQVERYWLLTHDILARFMRHFRFHGRALCITGFSSWDSPPPSSSSSFFSFAHLSCYGFMVLKVKYRCVSLVILPPPLKVRATIHKVHNNKKRLNPHLSLYEAAIFIV